MYNFSIGLFDALEIDVGVAAAPRGRPTFLELLHASAHHRGGLLWRESG